VNPNPIATLTVSDPIMLSAALALEPVSSYALGADLVLGLGVCLLSMAAADSMI